MADTYQHIDLTTLQRVEQLLTSADLGSGDERATRAAVPSSMSGAGQPADLVGNGDTLAPLPQRR
jgi:hypothetical protein